MKGYATTIKEASRELTARERIKMKDTSDAIALDVACEGQAVVIRPVGYAVLSVHNEKSDNIDYDQYIIESDNGDRYVTGSASFWDSFIDIFKEMGEEPFEIKAYKLDSKNYKGKQFLTCSIV